MQCGNKKKARYATRPFAIHARAKNLLASDAGSHRADPAARTISSITAQPFYRRQAWPWISGFTGPRPVPTWAGRWATRTWARRTGVVPIRARRTGPIPIGTRRTGAIPIRARWARPIDSRPSVPAMTIAVPWPVPIPAIPIISELEGNHRDADARGIFRQINAPVVVQHL